MYLYFYDSGSAHTFQIGGVGCFIMVRVRACACVRVCKLVPLIAERRWCVFEMMKLKIRLETDEWVYEEHEMV